MRKTINKICKVNLVKTVFSMFEKV